MGTAKSAISGEAYRTVSDLDVLQVISGATSFIDYPVQDILAVIHSSLDLKPSGVVGISQRLISLWQKFEPRAVGARIAHWKGDLNEVGHAPSIVKCEPLMPLRVTIKVNGRQVATGQGRA